MGVRRLAGVGVVAVAAALFVAAAFGTSRYTADSRATANKAGSKRQPARFVAGFDMTATGAVDGHRADAPLWYSYKWKGVRTNGEHFPRCSPDQIDKAQSDSVCPDGSLIAEAPLVAALGVIIDKTSILGCTGKTLRIYNNGSDAETWFLVGPPDNCNGVIYLAPFPATVTTRGRTSTHRIVVPDNVCHPVVGIECALESLRYRPNLKNTRIRKGGQTFHYMTSTACSGEREFTFVARDTVTTTTLKSSAGRCAR